MDKSSQILEWIGNKNIKYEIIRHEAAFTMQDIENLGLLKHGDICKNLFLRDNKGKRHFLVVVDGDKRVDLKTLGEKIGQRLSFASAERLERYLKLKQGEVSPLAVLFDTGNSVEVLFDSSLKGKDKIGFHPGTNTATVFLEFNDICSLIKDAGNPLSFINI